MLMDGRMEGKPDPYIMPYLRQVQQKSSLKYLQLPLLSGALEILILFALIIQIQFPMECSWRLAKRCITHHLFASCACKNNIFCTDPYALAA